MSQKRRRTSAELALESLRRHQREMAAERAGDVQAAIDIAMEPVLRENARLATDARRWRKLMDLAVYGGTYKGEHVWRFRPIMTPSENLLDAVDAMGEA